VNVSWIPSIPILDINLPNLCPGSGILSHPENVWSPNKPGRLVYNVQNQNQCYIMISKENAEILTKHFFLIVDSLITLDIQDANSDQGTDAVLPVTGIQCQSK